MLVGSAIGLELRLKGLTLRETHYDYLDGCSHWLYLLGPDSTVLDQLDLPDTFGFIQDVDVVSDSEVQFGFFGTPVRWSARIEQTGYWSFGPSELRYRLNRHFFAKRYVRLTRDRV